MVRPGRGLLNQRPRTRRATGRTGTRPLARGSSPRVRTFEPRRGGQTPISEPSRTVRARHLHGSNPSCVRAVPSAGSGRVVGVRRSRGLGRMRGRSAAVRGPSVLAQPASRRFEHRPARAGRADPARRAPGAIAHGARGRRQRRRLISRARWRRARLRRSSPGLRPAARRRSPTPCRLPTRRRCAPRGLRQACAPSAAPVPTRPRAS